MRILDTMLRCHIRDASLLQCIVVGLLHELVLAADINRKTRVADPSS